MFGRLGPLALRTVLHFRFPDTFSSIARSSAVTAAYDLLRAGSRLDFDLVQPPSQVGLALLDVKVLELFEKLLQAGRLMVMRSPWMCIYSGRLTPRLSSLIVIWAFRNRFLKHSGKLGKRTSHNAAPRSSAPRR
eukprot:m.145250 g.145250  ORF g.145250 m.145250 type:complete len:134 (+) comp52675_c1_seq9:2211-2612(+)